MSSFSLTCVMDTTTGAAAGVRGGREDGFDEYDGREFGIVQCLPVSDAEPNFDSEQPLTVEEYLRRVRWVGCAIRIHDGDQWCL